MTRNTGNEGAVEPGESDPYAFIERVDGRLNFETHIVLVVDDEASMRRLIRREIKHAASDVLTMEAANGQQALEKLQDIRKSFRVDPLFIVMDLKMPVMDGWDLLKELHRQYTEGGRSHGIPVIVMSSTSGQKGVGPFRRTIHGPHADYAPLVTVAKEGCLNPIRYDAVGKQGLTAWIRHFLGAA